MVPNINFDLISQGGPIMVALVICSIISLAIIIERLFFLRSNRILQVSKLVEIEVSIKNNDLKLALDWAQKQASPMMRVAKVALINADKPKAELKSVIEEAGRMEVPVLEKYLSGLHTIAVISPLLGLLGTVLGMIQVFSQIVETGTKDPSILAGGISQALLTTAAGLTVAIPTLIFFNLISKMIDNLISKMEYQSITLYEILTGNY